MTATACIKVRILNRGDKAGDGFCRLEGGVKPPNGDAFTVRGPRVALHAFAPGATLFKILPWTKNLPNEGFGGYCEPGLRL